MIFARHDDYDYDDNDDNYDYDDDDDDDDDDDYCSNFEILVLMHYIVCCSFFVLLAQIPYIDFRTNTNKIGLIAADDVIHYINISTL